MFLRSKLSISEFKSRCINLFLLLPSSRAWLTFHSCFPLSCHLSSVVHSLTHSLRMQHLLGLCPADLNISHKAQYPFSFYEPPMAVQGSSVCLYPNFPCVPSSQSSLIWHLDAALQNLSHIDLLYLFSLTRITTVTRLRLLSCSLFITALHIWLLAPLYCAWFKIKIPNVYSWLAHAIRNTLAIMWRLKQKQDSWRVLQQAWSNATI